MTPRDEIRAATRRYPADPARIRKALDFTREPDGGVEIAEAALSSLMAGWSPRNRAEALAALQQDLAEGGSLTVRVGPAREVTCQRCGRPVRRGLETGTWWAAGEAATGARSCDHEPEGS